MEANTKNTLYSSYAQANSTIQGIEAIDYFFAKEMFQALIVHKEIEVTDKCEQNLYHLFLALSSMLRAGHSCLSLANFADLHWGKGYENKRSPLNEGESEKLTKETLLSHKGFTFASLNELQAMFVPLNLQASSQQLLVLVDNNLYLKRYYQFEQLLTNAILQRLSKPCQYDNNDIKACISTLFPDDLQQSSDEIDWQKIAVANAINKDFSVIAGGPGTGKTYTVTKLLAALLMLQQQTSVNSVIEQGHSLNIALVAPTGKAAQRLSESIIAAISGFASIIDEKVLQFIPTEAQTIHRLLGVIPNSPNFRHHQENKLPYDVVLIDEVSMVDLPLMARTFRALKDSTKVILLGDADQLPSVAAGSVLADIAPRPHHGYSLKNNKYLADVCQLNVEQLNNSFALSQSNTINEKASLDYLSFLVKSRRFDGKGGIGLLANEVIKGQAKSSWQRLLASRENEGGQLSLAKGQLDTWLKPLVNKYYQPIARSTDINDAFSLLAQFRVLCATRQGPYGVEQVNELIKGYLGKSRSPFQQGKNAQQNQQALYHGQPIMINENDYRLKLYNGDIGILWQIEDQDGNKHLMACFESDDERQLEAKLNVRQILPSRLPKFETVYAMTIHKTQGSEFSHVAMTLSASDTDLNAGKQSASQLLTRELLYTGITRAKKHITLCTNQMVWQQGVQGKVQRSSGLKLC